MIMSSLRPMAPIVCFYERLGRADGSLQGGGREQQDGVNEAGMRLGRCRGALTRSRMLEPEPADTAGGALQRRAPLVAAAGGGGGAPGTRCGKAPKARVPPASMSTFAAASSVPRAWVRRHAGAHFMCSVSSPGRLGPCWIWMPMERASAEARDRRCGAAARLAISGPPAAQRTAGRIPSQCANSQRFRQRRAQKSATIGAGVARRGCLAWERAAAVRPPPGPQTPLIHTTLASRQHAPSAGSTRPATTCLLPPRCKAFRVPQGRKRCCRECAAIARHRLPRPLLLALLAAAGLHLLLPTPLPRHPRCAVGSQLASAAPLCPCSLRSTSGRSPGTWGT